MVDAGGLLLPFLSSAAGVCFGAGLVWGYVRTKIHEMDRRQVITETKLEQQVGDSRCSRMRIECKQDILSVMQKIERQLIDNRDYMTDQFVEIARYMGQHNGA